MATPKIISVDFQNIESTTSSSEPPKNSSTYIECTFNIIYILFSKLTDHSLHRSTKIILILNLIGNLAFIQKLYKSVAY